jgi:uroporphyrinogen-III synthase
LIPLPVAPLKGIAVLVTRPSEQSESLCAAINARGGEAIAFPTIQIEPIDTATPSQAYDWLVFISVNAVRYGLARITRTEHTRIAAIGKATSAALAEYDLRVDAVSNVGSNSEALLADPAFANVDSQLVLIVKGAGGRDFLHKELTQRGAQVTTLDVYRRMRPNTDPNAVALLEQRWRDGGIDIVTLTSVETLDNLLLLLTDTGREFLKTTPLVAASERIASTARERGLQGSIAMSRGADDDAIVGAIAAWYARAR